MSGKLYALSTGPRFRFITVRAARTLGQLDILYAPAGRKGGDSPGAVNRAGSISASRPKSAAAIFL